MIRVESRGKAMLIHFDCDLTIFSHNQLYGRWYVGAPGKYPRTNRTLRLEIRNRHKAALLYSASEIDVLHRGRLTDHPFLARLGPDILDRRTTPRFIRRRVRAKAFTRRHLSALLLDQGFLAGVGNYLRSEILFDARLHPDRTPADLDTAELQRFSNSVRRISKRTYRHRGVCTAPAWFRTYLNRGERRGEARFHVYGRDGRPCRVCGDRVVRTKRSSRALFYCPSCQSRKARMAPRASATRRRPVRD